MEMLTENKVTGMECLFFGSDHVTCKNKGELKSATITRIETIKKKSIKRGDTLHAMLDIDVSNLKYHQNCMTTYISEEHIKRYIKNHPEHSNEELNLKSPPPKRSRRSLSFDWKCNCLFCGDECTNKDPKNPARWRPYFECHTSERTYKNGEVMPTFKEIILEVCDKRQDEWSDEVRLRISDTRCLKDLHTADARYHDDCRKKFLNPKEVDRARKDDPKPYCDKGMENLIRLIKQDTSKVWTSVEVHEKYAELGGKTLNRRNLVEKLADKFGDTLLVLSSPGIVSILLFKQKAASLFKVQEEQEEEIDVRAIAKQIITEIREIPYNKDTYKTQINAKLAKEEVSPTLAKLLSNVSADLTEDSLPAILIGNMITSLVAKRKTDLLVDLAVMIYNKSKIQHLHDYGVVCSYDEYLRFRSSAAVHASQFAKTSIFSNHTAGLVQAVADNFDCNISSMNGLKQTHSLALMMLQHGDEGEREKDPSIKRLPKDDIIDANLPEIDIINYTGPRDPEMPKKEIPSTMTDSLIDQSNESARINSEFDFSYLKSIAESEDTPAYSGYCTRQARESGRSLGQATTSLYLPLIDAKPADKSTILTAMIKATNMSILHNFHMLQAVVQASCSDKMGTSCKVQQIHTRNWRDARFDGIHFIHRNSDGQHGFG